MSGIALRLLGGISADEFLRDYWQKQPLLVRGALTNLQGLIDPNELAGFSLDYDIESRIVIERSPVDWEVLHGPFTKKTFKNLPKTHWTLLIQALDHAVPQVAALLDQFNFIPNWRIDDVMASYAPAKGSVGPHFDQYDVFLIQGHGQRRWRIGQQCDSTTELLANAPLKLVKEFETEHEWLLDPGDMLYLPPGIAHYGVAENECLTYSVGFRAPSHLEILNDFVHYISLNTTAEKRYQDPELEVASNPGFLSPQVIDKFIGILTDAISDREQVTDWLSSYISQTKYEVNPDPPTEDYSEKEVLDLLKQRFTLQKEESSRFVYTGSEEHPEQLYVNGARIPMDVIPIELVLLLCKKRVYPPEELYLICKTPEALALLTDLLNIGVVYFGDEAHD